jgi:MobA/MobL family
VHREIVTPEGAPTWAHQRERLWNSAEAAERRKNSTVVREFLLALPSELNGEDRLRLAVDFARAIADKHRCAVDVSLHKPGRGGDTRNHHAHLLCTTRRLKASGFDEKTRELDDAKTGEICYWRTGRRVLPIHASRRARLIYGSITGRSRPMGPPGPRDLNTRLSACCAAARAPIRSAL